MIAFLLKFIGYGVLVLGVLGLLLYLVALIRYGLSEKKEDVPLPWWVFWRP